MNKEIIIINDEPFYRIQNGTSYDYAPIPKQFKPYFERLQQENQSLKEQVDYLRRSIERKEETIIELEHERIPYTNEYVDELKKQLEEYQLQNIDLRADIMIQKKAFPHKEIKDKTFYDLYNMSTYEDLLKQLEEYKQEKQEWINLLAMFKNQQKEFIEYLENEIKERKIQIVGYNPTTQLLIEQIIETEKMVLSKYKEIIGGK